MRTGRPSGWTEARVAKLRDLWLGDNDLTAAQIAAAVGMTKGATKQKAGALGLKRPPGFRSRRNALNSQVRARRRGEEWPPALKEELRRYWCAGVYFTAERIAEIVGRPPKTCRNAAQRFGFTRHPSVLAAIQQERAKRCAGVAENAVARDYSPSVLTPWPPHRFEDDPRAAEDWRFAQPQRIARPAPDVTLGGVSAGTL